MNSVWCDGTQPVGTPSTGGVACGSGSVSHGTTGSPPCERTGLPAAAIAAGLVEVWSTIRLLTTRGSESKTVPFFCLYDDGALPAGPGPSGSPGSASRKDFEAIRGNNWSAEPNVPWPSWRLLHEPSTVRRPLD